MDKFSDEVTDDDIEAYYIENRSEREIAEADHVAQQSVSECLFWAKKKIKKYFSDFPKNTL